MCQKQVLAKDLQDLLQILIHTKTSRLPNNWCLQDRSHQILDFSRIRSALFSRKLWARIRRNFNPHHGISTTFTISLELRNDWKRRFLEGLKYHYNMAGYEVYNFFDPYWLCLSLALGHGWLWKVVSAPHYFKDPARAMLSKLKLVSIAVHMYSLEIQQLIREKYSSTPKNKRLKYSFW